MRWLLLRPHCAGRKPFIHAILYTRTTFSFLYIYFVVAFFPCCRGRLDLPAVNSHRFCGHPSIAGRVFSIKKGKEKLLRLASRLFRHINRTGAIIDRAHNVLVIGAALCYNFFFLRFRSFCRVLMTLARRPDNSQVPNGNSKDR